MVCTVTMCMVAKYGTVRGVGARALNERFQSQVWNTLFRRYEWFRKRASLDPAQILCVANLGDRDDGETSVKLREFDFCVIYRWRGCTWRVRYFQRCTCGRVRHCSSSMKLGIVLKLGELTLPGTTCAIGDRLWFSKTRIFLRAIVYSVLLAFSFELLLDWFVQTL